MHLNLSRSLQLLAHLVRTLLHIDYNILTLFFRQRHWLCVKRWMNCQMMNLLLLTDSLSVLQALANLSIKSHKIILRLAAKIATREKFHQNIVLLWTPGHAGIKWNETADTLARRVSESDLNIQWVTVEDIITQLKVHSENQTDATYRGSKYCATLGDIPSIQTIAPWLKNM
ncbi:hypothetical protein AVEN_136543-1 [Araneus ventricosus]|uniref:Uncharacterized protein n=1 Tax=Araneus ventricosus TaxID=182803 RepID=A0A4Y2WH01_ARAVE|nr:hypothetical protein AVEN_136543-1 [Araneus ventricosus]